MKLSLLMIEKCDPRASVAWIGQAWVGQQAARPDTAKPEPGYFSF
nr:hypothetical protein [Amylibacter sp.]